MTRIKWEQLSKDDIQRNFCKEIDEKFKQLPSITMDIETKSVCFRIAIIDAATKACGSKQIEPHTNRKNTVW